MSSLIYVTPHASYFSCRLDIFLFCPSQSAIFLLVSYPLSFFFYIFLPLFLPYFWRSYFAERFPPTPLSSACFPRVISSSIPPSPKISQSFCYFCLVVVRHSIFQASLNKRSCFFLKLIKHFFFLLRFLRVFGFWSLVIPSFSLDVMAVVFFSPLSHRLVRVRTPNTWCSIASVETGHVLTVVVTTGA